MQQVKEYLSVNKIQNIIDNWIEKKKIVIINFKGKIYI